MLRKIPGWPQKLKYRLFTAFLLFILIPLFCLQFYSFNEIERSITGEFALKTKEQLDLVKVSMESIVDSNFRHYLSLEKSPSVRELLRSPENMRADERQAYMNTVLTKLTLPSFVQYTIADLKGDVYVSPGAVERPVYDDFVQSKQFAELHESHSFYRWYAGDVISLFAVLTDDEMQPFGFLRITFSYGAWLNYTSRDLLLQQNYLLLNTSGNLLTSTDKKNKLEGHLIQRIIQMSNQATQLIDQSDSSIVNSVFVYDFQWYLVSQLPMKAYLGQLQEIKSRFFTTFFLLCFGFIVVTFFISSAISRPLRLLVKKMSETVEKELRVQLPKSKFKGELQEISVAFNQMVSDAQQLLDKLKLEERQKEAVRFQMLLAQMNPHFLLNTLNTIKWNALDKDDEETAGICTALGKLLETSLNSDVELIFLKQELDLLATYFYIHNIRYEGMFQISYEVEDGLDYTLVPKFSLQPLVENCFKHGFSTMPDVARVIVRIYQHSGRLRIEVEDNGIGIKEAKKRNGSTERRGIGILNVQERLKLLFPIEGELEMIELESGTLVRLTIPLLISTPYQTGGDNGVESASGRG